MLYKIIYFLESFVLTGHTKFDHLVYGSMGQLNLKTEIILIFTLCEYYLCVSKLVKISLSLLLHVHLVFF